MKKPKPERFDPNYQRKTTKGPKPEEIDLTGVVPLKQRPKGGPVVSQKQPPPPKPTEQISERTTVRTDERSNERTDERPKRVVKRHSYDVFVDQIEAIENLATERKRKEGRHVTKGEIIQELLDKALNG